MVKNEDKFIRVWEKSIDVQIHFNDLIMRNRMIATSFITAVFGAAAYSLKDSQFVIMLFSRNIHISLLIIVFGILFLIAYAVIDLFYYYNLLAGSVAFTKELDEKHKGLFGLTTAINKQIGKQMAWWVLLVHYFILIGAAVLILFFLYYSEVEI